LSAQLATANGACDACGAVGRVVALRGDLELCGACTWDATRAHFPQLDKIIHLLAEGDAGVAVGALLGAVIGLALSATERGT
jgi:hypothetical protein